MSHIYSVNDTCVCLHRNRGYEAKILAIREKNGQNEYRVHYARWNTRYDEWVRPERLFNMTLEEYREKYEPERFMSRNSTPNVARTDGEGPSEPVKGARKRSMKFKEELELTETPRAPKRKLDQDEESSSQRSSENEDPSKPGPSKRRKMSNPMREVNQGAESTEQEDLPGAAPKIKLELPAASELKWPQIQIPEELRKILADDYLVMKKEINTRLQANCSIDKIVNDHIAQMEAVIPNGQNLQHPKLSMYKASARCTIDHINMLLKNKLFYASENSQFNRINRRSGKAFRPSSVYGIVHLLRLLVYFPKLVVQPGWIQHDIDVNIEGINYFVEFLGRHWRNYYSGADGYENCTEERFKEIVENSEI